MYYPPTDAVHETLEITRGWTPWFETGLLHLFLHPARPRLELGGGPYPPACASPGGMALARRPEPFRRGRLPAALPSAKTPGTWNCGLLLTSKSVPGISP